jgi:filamentous hemagglutinin
MLIKVVLKGEGVSPTSGYWLTQQQAAQIAKMTPEQAANALALPLAQAARMLDKGMDFYAITPKSGVTPSVFVSDIAPATQGGINISGGAKQVIVPNRTLWNEPKAINPNTLRLM